MRTAKIGTILPWGGDGGTGFLASNIPKGWIVCDGSTLPASDYPLLASVIGDTYGGDMTDGGGNHYQFPYIATAATFRLPQLSASVLMDLERFHLDQPAYQMGQSDAATVVGSLVSDYGETTIISTTYEATSDIDFSLNIAGNLYFKFSDITLQAPDFLETVHTLNRKLGINHTPAHGHSDTIPSVNPTDVGVMNFRTDLGITMTGSATIHCNVSRGPNTCALEEGQPTTWSNGATNLTFYGDANKEHTLPMMDSFREYVQDSTGKNYWNNVPAGASNWRGTNRGSGQATETYTQTVFGRYDTADMVDITPEDSHATPCHTGMFPRPMETRNRPNFFGYDTGAPVRADGLVDDPETSPVFTVNSVTITASTNKFQLPAGTDIRRVYGDPTGTQNVDWWYQFDQITPLMYIVDADNDQKYTYLREGTWVQTIEDIGGGVYEITLNQQTLASGTRNLVFKNGTWPTSMNLSATNKDPLNQAFKSHNHGSFEISQGMGSMSGPPSHTASDADGSALQADSLENALNISADVTQPSATCTFLIKAY